MPTIKGIPGPYRFFRIEPTIRSVRVSDDEIAAELSDGRTISVPLAWSWRLS